MNRAQLEQRLDAIAGEIAAIQPKAPVEPDNPFEWMRWVDTGSLMWIDGVIERWNLGIEPTAEEQARWLALEAAAIGRMLSSVPASGRAVLPLFNDPR